MRALLVAAVLVSAAAHAQTMRLPGAPVAPKSFAECDAVDAQWRQLSSDINRRHSSCLESAACKSRQRNPAYRGPCSCEACHGLHDAMVGYPKLRASQAAACRKQVQAHLQQEKAREEQLARMRGPTPQPTTSAPARPALDLTIKPPVHTDPNAGERILRERVQQRIREREQQQAVVEGTVRALTSSREDAAEQGAEAMGQGLSLGVARALGIKHTADYEAEAEAILQEREFQNELMKELEEGMQRDLQEIERVTIQPPLLPAH